MPNRNNFVCIGHCGADPELKQTKNGTPVVNLSVATSSGKDDKKVTEWHRIVAYRDEAELIAKNFHKGDAIHVEGRVSTRGWEDVHGDKKFITEIICNYLAKPLYKKRDASQPPRQTQQQPVTDELPF